VATGGVGGIVIGGLAGGYGGYKAGKQNEKMVKNRIDKVEFEGVEPNHIPEGQVEEEALDEEHKSDHNE